VRCLGASSPATSHLSWSSTLHLPRPVSSRTFWAKRVGSRCSTIARGRLQLRSSGEQRPQDPIDQFFRSLAQDQGERATGIVLSGIGTDGTLGLSAIRAAGLIEHEPSPLKAPSSLCPTLST
jgi:hypothetical protein